MNCNHNYIYKSAVPVSYCQLFIFHGAYGMLHPVPYPDIKAAVRKSHAGRHGGRQHLFYDHGAVLPLAFALHPTSFNLANSLRASGDVRNTMYIGIGSMVVFRLGTAMLLGVLCGFGVYGVWAAMGMDWLTRSVASVIRYKSGKWRQMKTIYTI